MHAIVAALAACAVGGAVCSVASASSGTGATGHTAATTTLRLAATQLSSAAIFALGVEKGFFQRAGINLQLDATVPSPQVFPQLLGGQAQLVIHSGGQLNNVRANGSPIVAVAPAADWGTSLATDDIQLLTPANSGIKSLRDLGGKTIAVPQVRGALELAIRVAAAHRGIPQNSLKFAQLNFPDMGPALRAGRIQAAALAEPFLTQATMTGKWRRLLALSAALSKTPGPLVAVLTTESWANSNKRLLAAFRKADLQSQRYAKAHPKELRAAVRSVLKVPQAVANRMILPNTATTINVRVLQRLADLQQRFGLIPKKMNASSYVWLK